MATWPLGHRRGAGTTAARGSQWLQPGAQVPFTVPAFPGQIFTAAATYRRHAVRLSQSMRSELMEMDVPNAAGQFKAGMYAQLQVVLPTMATSRAVPVSAVFARPDQPQQSQVIRVQNGRAHWVPVRRWPLLSRDSVKISGALTPGDMLVREASEQATDGQPVSIAKLKPAGA